MTVVLPPEIRAQLLRRAAQATSAQQLDALAEEHGLLPRELVDLLKRHQAQPVRPTPAPTTAPTPHRSPAMQAVEAATRDHVATLLHQASQSSSGRIRNAGKKIHGLLDDLREQLEADRERDSARKEVERLEAQLRAAKAKLTGKPSAAKSSQEGGPSSSEIRSWARNAGVDCPERGRVPEHVRQAYADAHVERAS